MADRLAQVESLKVTADAYQSKIEAAATQKEALTMAITAAEHRLSAMKLSTNPAEKSVLKSQADADIATAQRIKSASSWSPMASNPPPPEPVQQPEPGQQVQQPSTTSDEIGSWVAAVVGTVHQAPVYGENASQSSSSLSNLASSSGAAAKDTSMSDNSRTDDSSISMNSPLTWVNGRDGHQYENTSEPALSVASYSHIRRLAEPVSSRPLTTKEQIILLKASAVNGFKCAPWDKFPTSSDFALGHDQLLFKDSPDLSLSTYQQQYFQEWARPKQAIPPPSIIPESRNRLGPVMSTSRSIDLVQDAATDCSVVASLCAAIARAERGHDQIITTKLYPFDKNLGKPVVSPNGKYIVRLNFNGCWRKVVIDDRLPLSCSHRVLHVIDRHQPALLWPALIEKAYLKVRGGYDFPGSNSCSDLWIMTGWIPEQIHLQETDTVPGKLWERIFTAFRYGDVLITLGTGQMSSRQERELGLEGQHSYVVLDMRETDHEKLLLVKNPWAEGRGWRGPSPSVGPSLETSTASGSSQNSLAAYDQDTVPLAKRPHPTTFYIGLEQVIRHFESLYLNWNPGLFQHRQDIHFEWDVNKTEGGTTCIVSHPQFSFWSKDKNEVWFLLTRHFRNTSASVKDESDAFNDASIRPDLSIHSTGDALKGYMSFYVCTGNGQRLYIKDGCLETSDYVSTPQCLLRWDAERNTRNTVVVDQADLPPSKYTFTLSAFSNSEMTLEPAAEKYPFQKVEIGAWTKQTAGGSTSSSKYLDNPQYSLQVKERGPLAILLTSPHKKNALHVKLALGYGKRVYRLQGRDVLCQSGDHRTECVFAETEDVPPGDYTIICSLFEAGQTGDFTLRVDSASKVALKQIPRDGAGLVFHKLAPACFGAEVNKVAAPIHVHRLASYTIVARFLRATTPRAMGVRPVGRSPFRFSLECGRGPDRRFLITSENGAYSDATNVRSETVDIDPSIYKNADLWLVFDRLSGPGGPVEEWYDIEMFTDVPQACSVGVWRNWNV
ncbi:calpain-like protease palB/rim-13 [Byssothecium circinans]|uniref:Calpain-like protease palB/rim-13 n=1 Tax=Byssothecium circinans TaxID=147558 RepID=A0A6A5TVJ2_9PLEO|nr:calpain-like protease palB/rim-13 [Byssothecium circinans]